MRAPPTLHCRTHTLARNVPNCQPTPIWPTCPCGWPARIQSLPDLILHAYIILGLSKDWEASKRAIPDQSPKTTLRARPIIWPTRQSPRPGPRKPPRPPHSLHIYYTLDVVDSSASSNGQTRRVMSSSTSLSEYLGWDCMHTCSRMARSFIQDGLRETRESVA